MRNWWWGLTGRDRRMLILGVLFLCCALPVWLIWLPLLDRLDEARRSSLRLQTDLAWMEQAAATLRTAGADGHSAPGQARTQSLLGLVDVTARRAALVGTLRRVQPEGAQDVRVWIEDAPFDAVMLWLNELEQGYGIAVLSLVVDRLPASGRVNARILLREASIR